MEKNYIQPSFELVKQDEQNKTFFAASGFFGGMFSITDQTYSKTEW